MRLLICLAILTLVQGAPINEEAPEKAALEEMALIPEESAPEAPAAPEELATPEEAPSEELVTPEEVLVSEEPVAPEETPTEEEPVAPEESPASEEPVAHGEIFTNEEPVAPEDAPTSEEPVAPEEIFTNEMPVATEEAPTSGEPVAPEETQVDKVSTPSEEENELEAPTDKPIAPESEPIPEPHETPTPDSPVPDAEKPYLLEQPDAESHYVNPFDYDTQIIIMPELMHSESDKSDMSFIDYLLGFLFGDFDNVNDSDFSGSIIPGDIYNSNLLWQKIPNDIDHSDNLGAFSAPEHSPSPTDHTGYPLHSEGEFSIMMWIN